LIYQLKEQTTKGYLKKMYDFALAKLKTNLGAGEGMHVRSRSTITRTGNYGKTSTDVASDIKYYNFQINIQYSSSLVKLWKRELGSMKT